VIPVRTTKTPQPIGARHRWASSLLPLFSGFPSFQKGLADPLFPFFLLPRSQLSKARFSQERIAHGTSAHHSSNLQLRPAPTQHLSTILPFLIVLPSSVSPTQSTAPTTSLCHAATRLSKRWRPRLLQEQLACSKPRKAQLHFKQFHIHSLPPLETPLNILTLSDRHIGS
jgi:hypothetical protein